MDLRLILVTMPAAALTLLPALRTRGVPLRFAVRAAVNSAAGLALLLLIAAGGEGVWTPEIGAADLLVAGILGIPGVGLLYIVRWMLI